MCRFNRFRPNTRVKLWVDYSNITRHITTEKLDTFSSFFRLGYLRASIILNCVHILNCSQKKQRHIPRRVANWFRITTADLDGTTVFEIKKSIKHKDFKLNSIIMID